MDRRAFIAGLGVAAWPVVGRAQQAERLRRVGVLMPVSSDDRQYQARFAAFLDGPQQLGWVDRRNVHIDIRWGAGDADLLRKYAEELVALGPDVLMAITSNAVPPLQQATRAIPIVFAIVADPVGADYVESLARPGGNVTGFITYEYALAGKWLELLKEISPRTARVAVLRDTAVAGGPAEFGAIQAVAPSLGVELRPVNVRNADEIERAIMAFAASPNGGLIITGSPAATVNRKLIITLAAQHKLPAIYNSRYYATDGGLISYGPDYVDECRRAASYVDRILKGENPAELPVQAPTKYELVINLKTAMALVLAVPPSLLALTRSSNETARVHCGARECRGVAIYDCGAAVIWVAANWRSSRHW
jgi:putative ABC transport system substrate-binding protein